MTQLVRLSIDGKEWGMTGIMRPIPQNGDPWGVLSCLQGTPWADQIPIISGEDFSHATHGNPYPLLDKLGPAPSVLAKMLPIQMRLCHRAANNTCMIATPKCCPGPKLPDCYEAPNLEPEARLAAAEVALAWRDQHYVIIVEEGEFVI